MMGSHGEHVRAHQTCTEPAGAHVQSLPRGTLGTDRFRQAQPSPWGMDGRFFLFAL
ncbi:hypothetical protein [Anaerolinea sp.]|uniref:hypothetical protein n=1 Tax=Anaerolinea sp. TaxID=1872519 RepID=UPI002ACD63D7|nr:hypothetical protein [Anaerolinea sp.]